MILILLVCYLMHPDQIWILLFLMPRDAQNILYDVYLIYAVRYMFALVQFAIFNTDRFMFYMLIMACIFHCQLEREFEIKNRQRPISELFLDKADVYSQFMRHSRRNVTYAMQ